MISVIILSLWRLTFSHKTQLTNQMMKVGTTFVALSFVCCVVASAKRSKLKKKIPVGGSCMSHKECGSRYSCDYDDFLKRSVCKSALGGECKGPSDCVSPHVCVDLMCKSTLGSYCYDGSDCLSPAVCGKDNLCKSKLGGYCDNDSRKECVSPYLCDFYTQMCRVPPGGKCNSKKDCTKGYVCYEDICQSPFGTHCLYGRDMPCPGDYVCDIDDMCRVDLGGHCDDDEHCADNLVCFERKCTIGERPPGGQCESHRDCTTGYLCHDSKCKSEDSCSLFCNEE